MRPDLKRLVDELREIGADLTELANDATVEHRTEAALYERAAYHAEQAGHLLKAISDGS